MAPARIPTSRTSTNAVSLLLNRVLVPVQCRFVTTSH